MLELSDELYHSLCKKKVKAFFKDYPNNGVECFASINEKDLDSNYFIKNVYANNITRYEDGSYHLDYSDIKKDVLHTIGTFVKCKSKKQKCVSTVDDDCGKVIKSNYSIMNMCTPAFCTNEDLSINEYRFYLTLFNDYTVKQCQYERHNLHDASFTSSKYSLPMKLQNSNFLQSKDFKVINVRRKEEESVPVGLIIKEDDNKYAIEYGKVYINMDNKISIIWH